MSYKWSTPVIPHIPKFRPMLAAGRPRDITEEEWLQEIRFPVIASPKIDGIRCITIPDPDSPGRSLAVCRSLKPVPNKHIRDYIASNCGVGLDGELVTYNEPDLLEGGGPRKFGQVQSDVMTQGGMSCFNWLLFDYDFFGANMLLPYLARLDKLKALTLPPWCKVLEHQIVTNRKELLDYEELCVQQGHEGICFRRLDSPYKCGRSTMREQYLVKMKRFVTEEAVVIGVDEEMANNNPVAPNELGYAERSSHKSNMSGKGRMGALVVQSPLYPTEFRIGTGFTGNDREVIWARRNEYVGQIVTFKHQPHGQKDVPRIPVFVGFRSEKDL